MQGEIFDEVIENLKSSSTRRTIRKFKLMNYRNIIE